MNRRKSILATVGVWIGFFLFFYIPARLGVIDELMYVIAVIGILAVVSLTSWLVYIAFRGNY